MENAENSAKKITSANEMCSNLFENILLSEEFDIEISGLVKKHFGCDTPHSKAGVNLADELLKLAKSRAEKGTK